MESAEGADTGSSSATPSVSTTTSMEQPSVETRGMKAFELQPYKPKCGTLTARNLSNSHTRKYGAPYPANPPPYEVPHNPLRFLKKIPKKLLPKIMALTHMDRILREILLATIALDGPGREQLAQELTVLVDDLQEPIQKLIASLAGAAKPLIMTVPGLNVVMALGELIQTTKEGSEASGAAMGTMTGFLDKAKEIYDRSTGGNRLVASLMYALMDYLEKGGDSGFRESAGDIVGTQSQGKPADTPIESPMRAAVVARALTGKKTKEELLSMLKAAKEAGGPGVSRAKTLIDMLQKAISEGDKRVDAGMKAETTSVKGRGLLQLLQNITEQLGEKEPMNEREEDGTTAEPQQQIREDSTTRKEEGGEGGGNKEGEEDGGKVE